MRGILEIKLPLKNISQQVTDQVTKIRLIYSLVGLLMLAGFILVIRRLKQSEQILTLRSGELEVANQKLKDISESDALTGIPNRRCYNGRLISEVSAARRSDAPLSMLLIDIDYFKLYNDGYGHEQGDEALKQVARIGYENMLRATDFIARYGGEEFVVLLPFTDSDGVASIAENIRAAIEAAMIPHEFAGEEGYLTVSIGLATQLSVDLNPAELFKIADAALYQAKANGRNRCEAGTSNLGS